MATVVTPKPLKAPFQLADSEALLYALELLHDGHLSVDEEGRIWRNAICSHGKWVNITPRRAENVGGKGYLRLTLQIKGRLRSVMAHRVIWEHLVGPIPHGKQINHKDLDKTNNRLSNLEVVSAPENIQHSYQNGRNKPWSRGGSGYWRDKPLLDNATKAEVRYLREQGLLYREIAERVGISLTHAQRICTRKEGE